VSWTPFDYRKAVVVTATLIIATVSAILSSCFSERQSATGPLPLTGECRIPISSGAAGTVVVFIRNFAFVPEQVTIKRGTKVTWVNCEDAGSDSHTSTSDSGIWDSPTIQVGAAFTRTFNDATGSVFNYHCVPHPFMKGTINVE
jgi:plastocyanin